MFNIKLKLNQIFSTISNKKNHLLKHFEKFSLKDVEPIKICLLSMFVVLVVSLFTFVFTDNPLGFFVASFLLLSKMYIFKLEVDKENIKSNSILREEIINYIDYLHLSLREPEKENPYKSLIIRLDSNDLNLIKEKIHYDNYSRLEHILNENFQDIYL